jgi:hypothetical protein
MGIPNEPISEIDHHKPLTPTPGFEDLTGSMREQLHWLRINCQNLDVRSLLVTSDSVNDKESHTVTPNLHASAPVGAAKAFDRLPL